MQKQAPWLFGSPSSQVVLVNVCKYFLCMVENANYPSNSRVVVGHRFPFVQVVIIHGINFGHYLTLLCNKSLCLKITQKDLTVASNVLGH